MGFTLPKTTGAGGLFGADFDLTFEENQVITPGEDLFHGEEEDEELQTRPSPDAVSQKVVTEDCGPDDPHGPLAATFVIDDCGPDDLLPGFMSEFDTII